MAWMLLNRFIRFRCLVPRTTTGLPCSQGAPGACALLSDPGRTSAPRHNGAPVLPPLCRRRRLQQPIISRLNRTASARAVYASCRLHRRRRKTRFRAVASLSRMGLITHWVPLNSFRYALPLFLGFSWRDYIPLAS